VSWSLGRTEYLAAGDSRNAGPRRGAPRLRCSDAVEPRGREAEDREDATEPEDVPSPIDGPQEPRLVELGDAQAGEVGLERAQQCEQHAQGCGETLAAPLETCDPEAEIGERLLLPGHGDDVTRRSPEPACRRGAGDAEAGGDRRVGTLLNEADEAMVVGPLRARAGHRPSIRRGAGPGKT
jgi:hypothetical protein